MRPRAAFYIATLTSLVGFGALLEGIVLCWDQQVPTHTFITAPDNQQVDAQLSLSTACSYWELWRWLWTYAPRGIAGPSSMFWVGFIRRKFLSYVSWVLDVLEDFQAPLGHPKTRVGLGKGGVTVPLDPILHLYLFLRSTHPHNPSHGIPLKHPSENLQQEDSVRLVNILPYEATHHEHSPLSGEADRPDQTWKKDPIKCELQYHRLSEAPKYEALSYVWGTVSEKSIQLNGQPFLVANNLHEALLYLREKNKPRLLWIGALCINQGDENERGHQVAQMGDIYKSAHTTIIWLGVPTPEAEPHACGLFEAIKAKDVDKLLQPGFMQAFLQLSKHGWFKRVRVIQEAAISSAHHQDGSPSVAFGSHVLSFAHLRAFCSGIMKNNSATSPRRAKKGANNVGPTHEISTVPIRKYSLQVNGNKGYDIRHTWTREGIAPFSRTRALNPEITDVPRGRGVLELRPLHFQRNRCTWLARLIPRHPPWPAFVGPTLEWRLFFSYARSTSAISSLADVAFAGDAQTLLITGLRLGTIRQCYEVRRSEIVSRARFERLPVEEQARLGVHRMEETIFGSAGAARSLQWQKDIPLPPSRCADSWNHVEPKTLGDFYTRIVDGSAGSFGDDGNVSQLYERYCEEVVNNVRVRLTFSSWVDDLGGESHFGTQWQSKREALHPGDVLFLLKGALSSFVLRETGDAWRIVGVPWRYHEAHGRFQNDYDIEL
ncbi:HET-domain-containing protein [Zalerion maritima]|uniref:HET-domain-containing protein n=1 Tax=Zalerion maritima TaxID=339359 RepID=A0AAD5WM84_9PEZI|nr:HET-domain-containing protein [Zalerion maritima]